MTTTGGSPDAPRCKGLRITRDGIVFCGRRKPGDPCLEQTGAGNGSCFSGPCDRRTIKNLSPQPGEAHK